MPEQSARTATPLAFTLYEPLPWLQVPMEPMPRTDDTYGRGQAAEFYGVAGWPAQPKLVPTVITCEPLLVIAAGLAAAADVGWKMPGTRPSHFSCAATHAAAFAAAAILM